MFAPRYFPLRYFAGRYWPVGAGVLGVTVNLPTAVSRDGRHFIVKKIDSSLNTVTIVPVGIETIDDAISQVLSTQHKGIEVVSDDKNWHIIGSFP